ncbi:MAG: DUF6673 family protein [Ruminococcus sp.]|uniref:DUF6673 family protein n=1 Tax=Ruminococcus sp. TaxID=41978 RepID=UPI003F0BE3B7
MIINNVELPDIDVSDALVMENYEAAHDKVAKKMNNLDVNGKRRSELLRIQCEAVFEFFEDVFGEGTAKKVFGESVNLTTCLNAYEAVVIEVNNLEKKVAGQYKAKFGNRQQRRNQNKGKKKKHYNNRPQLVNKS